MKKLFFLLVATQFSVTVFSQFNNIFTPEDIRGVCDTAHVYDVFILPNCQPAKCPLTDREIEKRLNSEVLFLKENPAIKDKGGFRMIINCKGEVVNAEMDIKTQHTVLNEQVKAVFISLGQWAPAIVKGKQVDSARYWTFTIKKGRLRFDKFE